MTNRFRVVSQRLLVDHPESGEQQAARQALMIESRYFGGLDVSETASLLDVSEATILRDWRAAKAWLATQIVRTRTMRRIRRP